MTQIEQLKPGVHFDVPESVYRADPGLSQTQIKSFYKAATPFHFKYQLDNPKPPSASMILGSAVDYYICHQSDYANKYCVWRGGRRQGGVWEEFKTAAGGKTILTEEEEDLVISMVRSLNAHEDAARIISSSKKQVVVIAQHPTLNVRMKCLIDLYPESIFEWIFDLKAMESAEVSEFRDAAAKYGYLDQALWYMTCCRFAGIKIDHFGFVVVENKPPHQVAIHYVDYDDPDLEKIRDRQNEAIPKLLDCISKNNWPSYPTGWSEIKLKPWQLSGKQDDYERLT